MTCSGTGTKKYLGKAKEAVESDGVINPPGNAGVSASTGIVEHRDRPLSPVRHFSQADINHGRIAYRPPTAAPHLREIMAFSFAGEHPTAPCRAGTGSWAAALPLC